METKENYLNEENKNNDYMEDLFEVDNKPKPKRVIQITNPPSMNNNLLKAVPLKPNTIIRINNHLLKKENIQIEDIDLFINRVLDIYERTEISEETKQEYINDNFKRLIKQQDPSIKFENTLKKPSKPIKQKEKNEINYNSIKEIFKEYTGEDKERILQQEKE